MTQEPDFEEWKDYFSEQAPIRHRASHSVISISAGQPRGYFMYLFTLGQLVPVIKGDEKTRQI